jgi:formate/nitrite transporter FocA (FNT family)
MFGEVLLGGLKTGFSPAQSIDMTQYYGKEEEQKTDNTLLYIAIIAAVLISAGTIYFITKK